MNTIKAKAFRGTLCLAVLPALACLIGRADSAEIEVRPLGGDNPALVSIVGVLEPRDDVEFARITQQVPKAIVIMKSPGGNLAAGLSMGAQIRIKGYAAMVAENHLCASACALAWIGGERRYMSPGSLIGFHAAYVQTGEYKRESGMGNAVVGAYLNEMGLTLDAIKFITMAGPDEMTWLDIESSIKLGIDVTLIDKNATSKVAATPPSQIVPSQNARRAGLAYVSSDGHEYKLECSKDGYVLKSSLPVSRFVENGAGSRLVKLKQEKIYLGKDCDAYHKVFGGGRWCWANGGFRVEFPLQAFGFPRQELSCEPTRPYEQNCNC